MDSVKRYLTFVKPYKWPIIGTVIIGLLKFGIPLLIPLLSKYVVDDIIGNTSMAVDEKLDRLWWVIGIMLFIFVVLRPPIEYFRQYFAQWTGTKILFDIRNQLFTHIQKLSFKYYSNHRVGEVISRVITDVEQTKNFVITGLMNLWLDIATIIIAITIMFTMDVPLTIVSLIMLPFYAFSVKHFFGKLRIYTRVRSQALADLQSHLQERVQGMAVIKSFAIEDYEHEQFKKQNANFLDKALTHTSWNAKSFAVVNTITDIAPLVVIAYAGYQVIQGDMSIGTMVAFIGFIDRLYNPLRRLVNSSTTMTQTLASMDRVFEFIDEKYDIVDRQNAKEARNIKGHIQFDHVSFAYDSEDEEILKDINLDVKEGETIAFAGMSGGGKSSLVSLIPRFYDVTGGTIYLDGTDIREFNVRSLRDNIGMVLQDNILFSDSVKANILMGKPDASDEEVYAAARAANADEFIRNLPNGYDTKVGERGVKLSGGQRQRVAIARVFLKNPRILILDEATSALDLESEQFIQEALDTLAKNRTTFIVAHRLSTITHADRIVMVEHGKITEMGTHSELMKKHGRYWELYNVQQLDQA
ncbi:ABC transporter ATP-binding protein [Bacillus massiliglaciei]|uniref:ABC transporter ATP-binding protein n=1 Tax=Bacillus massiliglaciei TaxID=1816693 RepID=UPI000B2A73DA|nr:ABC transporter ATP-binding protein [Bacillus massiliglaciei]